MDIKILGTGCPKCKRLEKLVYETAEEIGIDALISKEEDIVKIMEYGILHTPGLVIDGTVVLSGRLPGKKELTDMISRNK
ncbi:MAG: TM0996/MTH895 family glutaredoxin-like protein [Bacteroidales bacterium]|nr:TM0996/MTH895 family glutaredoxin-like protein [Bacteroidales bacterium]